VICHCAFVPSAWEQVTGLSEADARGRLQEVMADYAVGLRKQAEEAAAPRWAEGPFDELQRFLCMVQPGNDVFRQHGMPPADLPWPPGRREWEEFGDRCLGG
jgi:hypothetical protein